MTFTQIMDLLTAVARVLVVCVVVGWMASIYGFLAQIAVNTQPDWDDEDKEGEGEEGE